MPGRPFGSMTQGSVLEKTANAVNHRDASGAYDLRGPLLDALRDWNQNYLGVMERHANLTRYEIDYLRGGTTWHWSGRATRRPDQRGDRHHSLRSLTGFEAARSAWANEFCAGTYHVISQPWPARPTTFLLDKTPPGV